MSSITISPASVTLGRNAGNYTFDLTLDNVRSVRAEADLGGEGITATISGNTLTITYPTNDYGTTITGSVIVVGISTTDGNTVTGTADLTQLATGSTLTVNPSSLTLDYGTSSKTFVVSTDCNSWSITNSNTSDFTVSPTTGGSGTTTVTVTTVGSPSGTTHNTGTLTVSDNAGVATSQTVSLTQNYIPTLTRIGGNSIPATGGTIYYTVHTDYDVVFRSIPSFVTITDAGGNILANGQRIAARNIDNTTITVTVAANPTSATRNDSGMNMGHYFNGSISRYDAAMAFTQAAAEVAASILINPNSITLAPTQTTAQYTITYTGIVGNITHSISGNVGVASSTITPIDSNSCYLTVVTNNNTTSSTLNSTITVTGTSTLGATITETATLVKAGTGAGIIISPVETTIYGGVTTGTFNLTYTGIDLSTVNYSINGDVAFDTVAFNSDKSTITANWAENTGSLTRTGTITVTGRDSNNVSYSATTTINQYAKPFININEESKTIGATTSYVSYFVRMENINNPRITSSGNVTITSSELVTISGGYRLEVYTANNTTDSMQTSIITITGTGNDGNTYSDSTMLYKAGTEGQITISPATSNVLKDSGYLFLVLSIPNMDRSTLQVTSSGTMSITSAVVNSSYDRVNVVYGANTSGSNKTATITVTGDDVYGNHKTASATIIQSGVGSSMTITPTSLTIGATQSTAQYTINVDGVSNLTATFGGEVVVNSHSFTTITAGSVYRLNVVTANNTTTTDKTSTVTVTGTNTLGQTVISRATLVKSGISGTSGIVVSPTSWETSDTNTYKYFDLTLTNIDTSTMQATTGGEVGIFGWPEASFRDNYTSLLVNISGNASSSDCVGYVYVSGTDYSNVTHTVTIPITAHPSSQMTVTPSSKTLGARETTAQWFISTRSISGVTASFSGNVSIASHSIEQVEGGYYLIVNTNDNTTENTLTSTITLTGTKTGGGTITRTVTLNKSGMTTSSLVIEPLTKTVDAASTSTTFTVTAVNVDTSTYQTTCTGIATSASVSGNTLTVNYTANTTPDTRYGAIAVAVTDLYGQRLISTVNLSQTASSAYISISPEITSVTADSGTLTLYITGNELASISNFTHTGSMNVTSCTYEMNQGLTSGTITMVYEGNSTTNPLNYTIVINATTDGGLTASATSTITQSAGGGGDEYVFEFDPASQASKYISYGSQQLDYTINSSINGTAVPYTVESIIYSGVWSSEIVVQQYGSVLNILVPANNGTAARSAVITFQQNRSDLTISSVITQYGYTEGGIAPIWEEVYFSEPIDTFLEYHISDNDNLIYAGKAYKYPDASRVEWSVNDVCSNYLGTGITFTEGIQEIPNYAKTFVIGTNTLSSYEETFYNSWAYKHTDYWLSDPIDKRVDPRQWLPVSFLSTNYDSMQVGDRLFNAPSFNKGYTVMINLRDHLIDCNSAITALGINGTTISYKVDCADFVLYYANAYNGWDSLLVSGTVKKTDNIEPYNYRQFTKTRNEFSKTKYLNVITPTWTLNTGLTIDGEKMYHLLESTMVYLHNLKTNEIIPVVITDTQCQYLNYWNNGKKPYYYTITVEESNLKIRK